jgi:deoxyribonuclease-4
MVFIGAHISRDKTLIDTLEVIKNAGGNSLQIFASNPRSTKISPLNQKFFGENPGDIKNFLKLNNFKLVIHNPYTINLATPFMINKRTMEIKDCYWIKLILHELEIAHLIGAIGCVVHCGKYTNQMPIDGIKNMKLSLDYVINEIEKNKWNSKIILETSTGQGTELLSLYQDFLDFYNSFNDKQKEFIKICIDTCHVWAGGFELKEIFELTKKNKNIKDIQVIHINNSKNPKKSHLDRHDIITNGYIKLDDILDFLDNFKKVNKEIILILETPNEPELKKEFNLIK